METEDRYSAKIAPGLTGYHVRIMDGEKLITGDFFHGRWRALWYAKRTLRRLRTMGEPETIR